METIKEKEYCILVLDNTKQIEEDLNLIVSEPFSIIHSKSGSVSIATFKTNVSPSRLKRLLNRGELRSFFIFELNANTCSAFIDDVKLQEFLFSELDRVGDELINLEKKDKEIIEGDDNLLIDYDESKLSSLSEKKRNMLIDKLLNNPDLLTDNQKKILNFLTSL